MDNQGFAPYRSTKLFILLFGLMVLPLLLMAFPRTVQAQAACSGTTDYGDAPNSSPFFYGVACATPSATLYIGSVQPDTETVSQFSAGANGDDILGTDDESFLNPLTPIDVSNTTFLWSVPVSNTTANPATLAGWIDFNGNGIFDDNERATVTVPRVVNASNVVTLTWSIPITASFNITTYVRLRISTDPNVGPTGIYGGTPPNNIGEVEDYTAWMLKSAKCDPGTSFYYIDGGAVGSGGTGNAVVKSVDVSTGISTTVDDPPTLTAINGLAVDNSRALIFYQDVTRGIYGYNLFTHQDFTVTLDASGGPLNITDLTPPNTWTTAAGAFGNGKYYVGIDGNDSGDIWEITLNAAGTLPVSARLLISTPNAGCGFTPCNNYGDLLVDGNRLYVSLWENGSPYEIFEVYDINSGLRLNRQTIPGAAGYAFQLARNGNGTMYAIASNNGAVYTVTNGLIGGTVLRTFNRIVHDASECVVTRTPTAVEFSSFSAQAGIFEDAGRVIAVGAVGGLLLSAALVLMAWRRHQVAS